MSICFFIWLVLSIHQQIYPFLLTTYLHDCKTSSTLEWVKSLVISPLQHGWNCVVLFFPSTSFSLGMGGQFSSFPPHMHNPFSPFLSKRWTFFFASYNYPFLWNGCTICILLLMSISFEIAWYLFFWPPLISFLYKIFLCPHIFTPITLSMKSEIKRVNLCVLKNVLI